MIKAVLSGAYGTSEDETSKDAVGAGTPVAITSRTATPIDTVIRVATARRRPVHACSTRRRFLPQPRPGLTLGHRRSERSASSCRS